MEKDKSLDFKTSLGKKKKAVFWLFCVSAFFLILEFRMRRFFKETQL